MLLECFAEIDMAAGDMKLHKFLFSWGVGFFCEFCGRFVGEMTF